MTPSTECKVQGGNVTDRSSVCVYCTREGKEKGMDG